MLKDFYFVKDDDYTIIFHVPTSKLIKVYGQLDNEQYTDEQLYNTFSTYEREIEKPEKFEFSVGKPGIVFMASRTCNLGCKYCFAGEGEYGSIESKSKFMSCNLFMDSVKFILKNYPEGVKSISFFGGEPLLNFKEIKKFVPKCMEYFNSKNIEPPVFAVSTNLTLVDNEMIEFFKKYDIVLVSSIDGPIDINDKARVFKGKQDSVYKKLKDVTEKLNANGLEFHLQMVINKNHLNAYKPGEAVRWLEDLESWGFKDLAIVPVETDNPCLTISGEEDLKKLDSIAREITNYYIKKLYKDEEYNGSKGMIAPVTQIATNKYKRNCASGHSVFVDTDGNLYPCQLFCNDSEFLLGNIKEQKISKEKVEFSANLDRFDGEECKNCQARKICVYWCKGIQRLANGSVYKVCEARCVFQKAMIDESIKALIKLKKGSKEYINFWNKIYDIYGIKKTVNQ